MQYLIDFNPDTGRGCRFVVADDYSLCDLAIVLSRAGVHFKVTASNGRVRPEHFGMGVMPHWHCDEGPLPDPDVPVCKCVQREVVS